MQCHIPPAMRSRLAALTVLFPLLLGACRHTITTVVPDPPPAASRSPRLVALLAPVDIRLARGGGKAHVVERTPRQDNFFNPSPYSGFRGGGMGMGYGWGSPYASSASRGDDIRIKITGELGSDEVLVPMLDAFSGRLRDAWGVDNVRDAQSDPLAEDPDTTRAQAFLAAYPGYDAVAWVELVEAKAELPDEGALNTLFTLASVCSLGAMSWVFLIPVDLDTPTSLKARAYVITRSQPNAPLAVALEQRFTVKARGSVGADMDVLRADSADLVSRTLGAALGDALLAKMDP